MADSKMTEAAAVLQLVGIPLLLGLFALQYFQGKSQLSEVTSLRAEVAALHTQVVELKRASAQKKQVARAGNSGKKNRSRKKRGGQGKRPQPTPKPEAQPF